MSTFGTRLRELRKPISLEEFAGLFGIPAGTMGNYERDRNQPPFSLISDICSRFGVVPEWLLFGTGPKYRTTYTPVSQTPINAFEEDHCEMVSIPMVGARLSAGTGSWEVGGNTVRHYNFPSTFLLRKGNPQQMVVMKVDGDSMQPEIMDGDVVLIDQSKKEVRLGRIFAVGFEEAIYLKRIDMLPGKILLKSVNPAYPPVEIDMQGQIGDSFKVIGQVLWVGREYQE